LRSSSLNQSCIAGGAVVGGVIIVAGTWLSWFSLFAGLQPYRGIDVLNGRLLACGGLLSILAGIGLFRRYSLRLRWGIGLLGFALLAFASWSLLQLLVTYRQLSADLFVFVRMGPGLEVVVAGALIIFATMFFRE
jgi:hypothetical protein